MSDPTTIDLPPASGAEDRTVAIVSYLTLIGFIVAIIIHGNKKTALGAYHLRQALGLMVTAVAFSIASMIIGAIPVIGLFAIPLGWLALFVLWIMALVAAASGELRPVPVVGEHFQKWFAGVFA